MPESSFRLSNGLISPDQLFQRPPVRPSQTLRPLPRLSQTLRATEPAHLTKSTFKRISDLMAQGQAAPTLDFLSPAPQLPPLRAPGASSPLPALSPLSFGAEGESVTQAQSYLALLGFPLEVDGQFGPQTQAQIRALQSTLGLPVTGDLDAASAQALTQQVQQLRLSPGQSGAAAAYLRDSLNVLGYDLPAGQNFDAALSAQLQAFQRDYQMPVQTSVGADLALAIQEQRLQSENLYGKSPWHNARAFIPNFAMTAYHESGIYRNERDPYAVGAITTPKASDDLGGKTYGAYQFESYIYPDGTQASDKKVQNSTLRRFIQWPENPYGPQLRAAAQRHGLASSGFDQVWKGLAHGQNRNFGLAQERFLQHDKGDELQEFFDRAQVPQALRGDERLIDLVVGTTNHVGDLAKGAAHHLRRVQARRGPMSADQLAVTLIEHKQSKVTSWFQSSPGAWHGIRNRFRAELEVFR